MSHIDVIYDDGCHELDPREEKIETKPKKKRKKVGPITRLSTMVLNKICNCIKLGSSLDMAAAYAGVSSETIKKWFSIGNNAIESKSQELKDRIYMKFVVRVKKSIAEAQMIDLKRIDLAAEGGKWQAAAWKLENGPLTRDLWFKTRKLEHGGIPGQPIQVQSNVELEAVVLALPLEMRKIFIEAFDRVKELSRGGEVKPEIIESLVNNIVIDQKLGVNEKVGLEDLEK